MSAEWSVIYECFFTPSKYDFLVRVGVGVREDSNFTFKCVVRIGTKKATKFSKNITKNEIFICEILQIIVFILLPPPPPLND